MIGFLNWFTSIFFLYIAYIFVCFFGFGVFVLIHFIKKFW